MTNGCVLDNISRPHRQRSNAARKLECFWRRCRINTNRIGIWTFGGTEGQQALSNALIESIVYRVLSADILTGETWQGRDWTSVREDTVRGGAQMFQENCPRPTLSAPKTLLVIHCPHRCDPICSLIQLGIERV